MKRTGKVWTRIFPNIPVSKTNRGEDGKAKDRQSTMLVEQPGRIIFEIDG